MQTLTVHLVIRSIVWRLLRSSILAAFALVLTSAAATVLAPLAVPSASAQFEGVPVERLVNGDGTLNLSAGFSGSLDLRGWEVTLDSQRGPILSRASDEARRFQGNGNLEPQRAPQTPLSLAWSAFPHAGLNGSVYALALSGSDLYLGGDFTATNDGAVALNRIAKFSGGAWSALAHNGLSGTVYALAVSGSDLYVGGNFSQTGDGAVTNLNYIARFSLDTSLANQTLYLPLVFR